MHISQRLGFGPKGPEDQYSDLGEILAQLDRKTKRVGIPYFPTVGSLQTQSWPEKFNFSIADRIEYSRLARKGRETIRKTSGLSKSERKKKTQKLKEDLQIWRFDQVGLAHQAILGDDPLRQRFMQFWWNHFTVGNVNGTNFYTGDLYWNILNDGIDGQFSDLLYQVTKHPSMLTYLDNIYSVGENSQKGKNVRRNKKKKVRVGLNDNLARELLELHSVSPTKNYSEKDIRETAKILSGWGYIFNRAIKKKSKINYPTDYFNAFIEEHHEPGEKLVLGEKYSSGKKSLEELILNLSEDLHTRKFLCKKLCMHFISDNPKKNDLEYIEQVWLKTDGHLPSVHKAVIERSFISEEKKYQWPLTWLFSVLRISNANLFTGWDDLYQRFPFENRAWRIYDEIGQNFWSKRQPNGFSLKSDDWISIEHFDRRLRLSGMIFEWGAPKYKANDMLEILNMSSSTKELVSKGHNEAQKFTLLTCSPEFMGV